MSVKINQKGIWLGFRGLISAVLIMCIYLFVSAYQLTALKQVVNDYSEFVNAQKSTIANTSQRSAVATSRTLSENHLRFLQLNENSLSKITRFSVSAAVDWNALVPNTPDTPLSSAQQVNYLADLVEIQTQFNLISAQKNTYFSVVTSMFGLAMVGLICLSGRLLSSYFIRRKKNTLALLKRKRNGHKQTSDRKIEKNRASQKFYSSLDHHLRTPISAAIGMIELAKTAKSGSQRSTLLEKATNANFQILKQVDVLLEIINGDTINTCSKPMRFNLNEMLDDCLREFSINAEKNYLSIIIGDSIHSKTTITADYAKTKLALIGTIQHVLQRSAGAETVIKFDVSEQNTKHLTFSAYYKALCFEHQVDGEYKETDEKVVFAAFEYDQSIVKHLYSQLGAELYEFSEENGSRQVTINIPIELVPSDCLATPQSKVSRILAGDFAVVDDLATSRYLIQEIIESSGGKVHLFESGNEFLSALKNGQIYQGVVLDMHMPALSGLETLELIHVLHSNIHMPIVMVSADPALHSLSLSQFPMVKQILVKPLEGQKLLDVLWASQNHIHISSSSENVNVMLIEDEPINAEIMISMLHSMHYKVVHVASGSEAVDAYKKHRFDLVLVDLVLTDIDGHALTRKMRRLSDGAELPIFIAVTAKNSNLDRFRSQEVGMSYHLTKPVTAAELNRTIRLAMNKEASY